MAPDRNRPTARRVERGVRMLAVVVVLMSVSTVTAGCLSSSSAPSQERLECRGDPSYVSSVDAATGHVTWQTTVRQTTEVPPTVENGNVLVTGPCGAAVVDVASGVVRYDGSAPGAAFGVTSDRLFTRNDSGGKAGYPVVGTDLTGDGTVNEYAVDDHYYTTGIAGDRLLIVSDHGLTAYDQTRRGRSWSLQLTGDAIGPLVDQGRVVLVTRDDGSTYAVRLADGTLLWRSIPPTAATSYELRITVTPGAVVTSATDYHPDSLHPRTVVYANDASTGRGLWTRPALSVMAADRDLTLLRARRSVDAVDTLTGSLLWRRGMPDNGTYRDGPRGAASRTVIVPGQGESLGLDRATGRVRWRGPEIAANPLLLGGVLVAQTPDGAGVVAIDTRTGATLWTRAARRDGQELAAAPGGRVLLIDTDTVPHLMAG